MSDQSVERILSDDAYKPIPLDSRFVAPSRSETGQRFLGEQTHVSPLLEPFAREINKYINSTFGHLPINPFDRDNKKTFSETNFFSEDVNQSSNYVNTVSGHNQFIQEIIDFPDNNKYPALLLIGAKGSGKTFYINYLLSSETQNLYQNNKTLIFRLDLSQLYSSHPQAKKPNCSKQLSASDDILEFLVVKVLFTTYITTSEYDELDEFWETGLSTMSSSFVNEFNQKRRTDKYKSAPFDSLCVEDCFTSLKSLFESVVKEFNQDSSHSYYDEKNTFETLNTKLAGFMALVIFKGLVDYLTIKKLKLAVIIDGVDNIDYCSDKNIYKSTLQLINQYFIQHHGVDGNNVKPIIVLRNESATHLKKISKSFYRERTKEYRINEDQNILEILKLKCSVAKSPKSDYFSKIKSTYITKAANKNDDDPDKNVRSNIADYFFGFNDFTENYLTNLRQTILDNSGLHGIDIKNDKDILKVVYGNNVRAFLYNFLNVYKYERLTSRKEAFLSGRNIYKKTSKNQYIYTEGLLLNGRLYLDTNEEPYQFGKCIPNIFWFNCHKQVDEWHGLCLFRILQLASSNAFDRDELSLKIEEIFDYDLSFIESAIDFATQHGLFYTTYDISVDTEVLYRVSEKGTFILFYILTNLNVFYFLSLDTPLSNYVHGRSIYLKYHTQYNENPWDNYPEACVLTSLTFIRHILTQIKKEEELIPVKYKKTFKFPSYFPENLLSSMTKLVDNQIKFNPERGAEIIKNIQGRLIE